ncbi:MAG TPA: hypothetical protein VM070_05305, partial [Candidatus Saccharimonadales bacterium]|nr:hypothetical protein [Candidatus Saccharimonadales bacterium]
MTSTPIDAETATALVRLAPLHRERFADLETPVSAFVKLRPLGAELLLESAEGGERMGRWSFIGLTPRERVICGAGDDPVARLRVAMRRYAVTP